MADDDDLDDEEESDDAGDEEDADGEDGEDGEGSSAKGGKKKLILILGAVLLLVVGGIGGAYVTGLMDPVISMVTGSDDAEDAEFVDEDAVFYDLPELLVNLSSTGRRSTFLKIRIALELQKQDDVPQIELMMPRILDNFQVYLRELRIEDLKGSAGMYRLREELLSRVAAAAAPARVNDVLFKEMLVQ